MKKLILIVAAFSLILTLLILHLHTYNSQIDLLHPKQKKGEEFKRVNLKEYKEYVYINGGGLEPLMIIWWQEVNYPMKLLDHPFKKFCIISELRTIMHELDELSHNKNNQSMIPVPSERNVLRIYLSSWNQNFRILEIEFALDSVSNEFVSNYGRSAKLYELLSSKEKSEDFYFSPWKHSADSNEYKEHMRKMGEFVRSRRADPNRYEPNQ